MKIVRKLALGLLFVASGLSASELAIESAKRKRITVEKTQEESKRAVEQVAILKEAFNGCRGTKNTISQEQWANFPRDLREYIASFIHGDIKKLKLIAGYVKELIPSVVVKVKRVGGDVIPFGIFGSLDHSTCEMTDRRQLDSRMCSAVCSQHGGVTLSLTRTLNEEQQRIIGDKNSFAIFRNTRNNFVYKIHPERIQELLQLTESQLKYLIQLYAVYEKQVTIKGFVYLLPSDECLFSGGIQRKADQLAIHHSLPEAIKKIVEMNYKFAPIQIETEKTEE